MDNQGTKNWRAIRGHRPLNEDMLALYSQLMEAEVRLAEDPYLAGVARDLAARGGHLEVLAVLPDETVTLLREPPDPAGEPPDPAGEVPDRAGEPADAAGEPPEPAREPPAPRD